jgi:hypothetical protein
MRSVPTIGAAGSASVPGTNAALSTGDEGAADEVMAATGSRSAAAPADAAAGREAAIRQVAMREQRFGEVRMGRLYPFGVVMS